MTNGKADWKTLALVAAAIVIVVLLAVGRQPQRPPRPDNDNGPDNGPPPPPPEPTVSEPPEPDIIRVRKEEGNTYRTSVVGQVEGQALFRDWGVTGLQYFLYRWELVYDSHILHNDGQTIEEERRFLVARQFNIRAPRRFSVGTGWLLAIEGLVPGGGVFLKAAETRLNEILRRGQLDNMFAQSRAFSIEGKTAVLRLPDTMRSGDVRISGDNLTSDDREFLRDVSLLMDARTLPKEDMKPGERWTVDAAELATALDPELRGRVVGTLSLTRLEDERGATGQIAPLGMVLDATLRERDATHAVKGRFRAEGQGRFNKEQGALENASLEGRAEYERVSTNHFLFEARQEYVPTLVIKYKCYRLDDPGVNEIGGRTVNMNTFKNEAPPEIRRMME